MTLSDLRDRLAALPFFDQVRKAAAVLATGDALRLKGTAGSLPAGGFSHAQRKTADAKSAGPNPAVFNLGAGAGVTVLEAVAAFEAATGRKLPYEVVPPRDGDVAAIYATTERAREELGWTPERDLEEIMRTAWAWEQARPGKLAAAETSAA